MTGAIVGVGVAVLAACGGGANTARDTTARAGRPAETFARYDAGAVPGGPGAGVRYGFGHMASPAAVAAMDRDVGPDGAELPPGRGTVAQGTALYATQCAMCHGKSGEGMAPAYPQLVGRDPRAEHFVFASDPKLPHTIGNYWPYATTLFDYIRRAMPHTAPGSLTDDQVYALTAYLLAANKVIPDSATLDAAALRLVKMPYADRFVRDDRTGGPVVK